MINSCDGGQPWCLKLRQKIGVAIGKGKQFMPTNIGCESFWILIHVRMIFTWRKKLRFNKWNQFQKSETIPAFRMKNKFNWNDIFANLISLDSFLVSMDVDNLSVKGQTVSDLESRSHSYLCNFLLVYLFSWNWVFQNSKADSFCWDWPHQESGILYFYYCTENYDLTAVFLPRLLWSKELPISVIESGSCRVTSRLTTTNPKSSWNPAGLKNYLWNGFETSQVIPPRWFFIWHKKLTLFVHFKNEIAPFEICHPSLSCSSRDFFSLIVAAQKQWEPNKLLNWNWPLQKVN